MEPILLPSNGCKMGVVASNMGWETSWMPFCATVFTVELIQVVCGAMVGVEIFEVGCRIIIILLLLFANSIWFETSCFCCMESEFTKPGRVCIPCRTFPPFTMEIGCDVCCVGLRVGTNCIGEFAEELPLLFWAMDKETTDDERGVEGVVIVKLLFGL